ncbi:hypothetical protein GCM10027515_08870 [Schumannella luteola]|uniref:DnaJ homologue subfamily C member 28 conserved domain-containing protein n=1 Tax=Schumannella luteola TaxID=472059 RepID=A0A852YLA3_9MICO|nr:DUF1992 domain-containing protein [Schumannella luteola]NYG97985.1 hypothetical protein [Schumannella luteola]TPX01721.1 DUF1992 domain-containing protein [Schumannella luteola]
MGGVDPEDAGRGRREPSARQRGAPSGRPRPEPRREPGPRRPSESRPEAELRPEPEALRRQRRLRGEADLDEGSNATLWAPDQHTARIETEIQQAIRRGEFENLPGAGKPLRGIGGRMDEDWWIRQKIEDEELGGLGPPALTLRTENQRLDDRLDRMHRESEVREHLTDFNARVIEARRQLLGGPPVVTPTRDIDAEVKRWRERRAARAEARAEREAEEARAAAEAHVPSWWERARERRRARRAER